MGETLPLAGGHAVDFRANVGLLTRNVVIQGTSPFSQLDKHGGHVMLHSRGDESLIGRFENIECRYMGQGFRLGRYPIHFHMIGACSWLKMPSTLFEDSAPICLAGPSEGVGRFYAPQRAV